MKKIIVAGIGPGHPDDMTAAVTKALGQADVVVGYKYYFQFVAPYLRHDCLCVDTGMKRERQRARQALDLAQEGRLVVVISSGDAGIYGMAPLIYEMAGQQQTQVEVEVLSQMLLQVGEVGMTVDVRTEIHSNIFILISIIAVSCDHF